MTILHGIRCDFCGADSTSDEKWWDDDDWHSVTGLFIDDDRSTPRPLLHDDHFCSLECVRDGAQRSIERRPMRDSYMAGTSDVVEQLRALSVPTDASVRLAREMGVVASTQLIASGLRFQRRNETGLLV